MRLVSLGDDPSSRAASPCPLEKGSFLSRMTHPPAQRALEPAHNSGAVRHVWLNVSTTTGAIGKDRYCWDSEMIKPLALGGGDSATKERWQGFVLADARLALPRSKRQWALGRPLRTNPPPHDGIGISANGI